MIKRIDLQSSQYPVLLRQIKNPPEVLFVRGDLPTPHTPMVAVVGSRKCTDYGRHVTKLIVEPLARAGIVIVSGLAFGIDATAHQTAIDAGGRTIAVLASEVEYVTPREHQTLAERILDHDGAIISEVTAGAPMFKSSFPIRNRIISGMCLATVVVEATNRSGSIITAKAANDQGRQVFAVPGPIEAESSLGTNGLIKEGAHLLTSANDVLDALEISGLKIIRPKESFKPDTKEEAAILPLLGKQPVHIDQIIRAAQLPTSTISSSLTMMEIKGKVRHVGGNHYIIA